MIVTCRSKQKTKDIKSKSLVMSMIDVVYAEEGITDGTENK